jgi:RNA polymerase sigma-70 factor (ECF subfamily)
MEQSAHELLPTRWSLLSRLKDWDDQDSWRKFFDAYWQLIYNTGVRAGLTHNEAEDVVQEVVIAVAKKMSEFNTDPAAGSFKAWLLTLTQWRIKDQFRKRARQHDLRADSRKDPAQTATIERVPDPAIGELQAEWDGEWRRHLVQTALERVKKQAKPEMYQVFDFMVNKQWSALTVARRLQISLARVYYARCKVAALLKREIKRLENCGI